MVGDNAHGNVHLMVLPVLFAGKLGYLVDEGSENVGVVVGCLALKSHAEAFEAHAGVDNLCGQWFEVAVGLAVVLHEHKVPYFDNLGMVLVHHLRTGNFGPFFVAAEVDVDFAAGAARACIAHFPEIIVFVAVYDMVGGQMFHPYFGGFVVAGEAFGRRAFENGCIEAFGI